MFPKAVDTAASTKNDAYLFSLDAGLREASLNNKALMSVDAPVPRSCETWNITSSRTATSL